MRRRPGQVLNMIGPQRGSLSRWCGLGTLGPASCSTIHSWCGKGSCSYMKDMTTICICNWRLAHHAKYAAARRKLAVWRSDYNHLRPHLSLKNRTPAQARPAFRAGRNPHARPACAGAGAVTFNCWILVMAEGSSAGRSAENHVQPRRSLHPRAFTLLTVARRINPRRETHP